MEAPTASNSFDSTQRANSGVDANDYSRFTDLPEYDDDVSDTPAKAEVKLTLAETLSRANGFKDAGNSAFKREDFAEAGKRYTDGIVLLDSYTKSDEGLIGSDDVNAMRTSLHSNNAMVFMKVENWNSAIVSATAVLKLEKKNVKALFRRGLSYHKVGFLEESKSDLIFLLEIETTNAPAIKELAQVMKDIKESKQKEKLAFSKMFNKNIYADKESERLAKEKKEEIQREKDNDEWIKSKLTRRSLGQEELSFEDWKKERKESEEKKLAKDKENREISKKDEAVELENKRAKKAELARNQPEKMDEDDDDDSIYDEEDNKFLMETKKKGYCYFRNEQTVEAKALIGDITPKALQVVQEGDPMVTGATIEEDRAAEDSDRMKVSSWNHAGTWEEKDMTEFSKSRITAMCLQAEVRHSDFKASGSKIRACVTGVKSVEGEAQIVMARGKKRFIYDFNVTLDIEVIVEAGVTESGGDSVKDDSKSRRFKGSLILPEVSPNTVIESNIQFKKSIPASLDKIMSEASTLLQNLVSDKMKEFETEFKAL